MATSKARTPRPDRRQSGLVRSLAAHVAGAANKQTHLTAVLGAPQLGGSTVGSDLPNRQHGSAGYEKRWGYRCFAPRADDVSDDNDDDSRAPRQLHPTRQLNSYRGWSHHRPVPTDQRFVFIRCISDTPFGLRALDPQDWSNSSSLTSTNDSILTSPQPEKRRVGGSIPPLCHGIASALRKRMLDPPVGGERRVVVDSHSTATMT